MGTYISAEELRAHLGDDFASVDEAILNDYIDGIEGEIDERFGKLAPVTQRITPALEAEMLVLPRKAASISTIVEWESGPVEGQTSTTLSANDYRVQSPWLLERLGTGDNPRAYWSRWGVDVTFLPLDDSAKRKLVIVDVAKLEAGVVGIASVGGTSIRIGDYSEGGGGQGASIDGRKLEQDRNAIMRRLRHGKLVFA